MAYFTGEHEEGERVSFAVSDDTEPTGWTLLDDIVEPLVSTVGEGGLRDPFLIRDDQRGLFVLLATDLRVWPDHGWPRAVRRGSRSLVVYESTDLVTWSEPRLVQVSAPEAGNTWAPKAFWSSEEECWLVLWASALYADGDDRQVEQYQRMMVSRTTDFVEFSPAEVYLDAGHSVIDMTFLQLPDALLRFSKHSTIGNADAGVLLERGTSLTGPFEQVARSVGSDSLERAEGPAVALSPSTGTPYLILDEHGLRGCILFSSQDPVSAAWTPVRDAHLPPGSRHCSMLAITEAERQRLTRGR